MSFDPEAVREFEHEGWQRAAAEYDSTFAQATMPFVEALLEAAGVTADTRVLDMCCGTGIITAAAAARKADVSGLDFSSAMLAEARRRHPHLPFDEGDAEALPYADGSFDAVVSNFGIHHVPRPGEAFRQALRVLRPGGRLAFTTWAIPGENIAWKLLFDAISEHGDPNAANAPPSGGGLGTVEAVLRLLGDVGFVDARVKPVRREWAVAEPRDLIRALARGTVRTAALIAAQPRSAMPAIEAAIGKAAAKYRRPESFAVPVVALLGQGVKRPR